MPSHLKQDKDKLERRLKLLKCFSSTKHKCRYLCTANDENIEAVGELLHDYLREKIKIPNLKRVTRILHPIRYMIRSLADKTVKTQEKRKILLDFSVKLILYPIIKKQMIPSMSKFIKKILQEK